VDGDVLAGRGDDDITVNEDGAYRFGRAEWRYEWETVREPPKRAPDDIKRILEMIQVRTLEPCSLLRG
jgi:hypothetical protein